jgi:glycosyltransferase involved in cell wall biosynthesis
LSCDLGMLFQLPTSRDKSTLEAIKISSLADANWKEKDFENLLAENLTSLIREEYLMVISQERPRQEEPDILALDEEGVLYIFELKRTKSEPKHLLQVMRYGQRFGVYDYDRLNDKYKKFEKESKKDLRQSHRDYFHLDEELSKKDFNRQQKFIVVTNGIDVETLRSIKYWKDKGLPIESLTYGIYRLGDMFLLDFHPYSGQKEEYEIAETSNHIVNTNATYRPNAYLEMLHDNKASAYGSRKHAIDSLQKHDRVFLYHTGIGICAVGRVTSEERTEIKGHERYVECVFKRKVDPIKHPDKALSAREINTALGTNWFFRQTRFSISDEEADKIENLFLKKFIVSS